MEDTNVPENPQPEILGELTVGEMRFIEGLRAEASDLVREVGGLEVRKDGLLRRLSRLEDEARAALSEAAKRLGVPAGERWEVTPDGKVRRVR